MSDWLIKRLAGPFPIRVCADGSMGDATRLPRMLLPGSFNPLHDGHRQLAEVGKRLFQHDVAYELSLSNVDKPELDPVEVARRVAAFRGHAEIWLTRAPTFEQKITHFPGVHFLLGHDTAARLVDLKYYYNDSERRDRLFDRMKETGTRLIVGGRLDRDGHFQIWNPSILGQRYEELFVALEEHQFRLDCSSTELRARNDGGRTPIHDAGLT